MNCAKEAPVSLHSKRLKLLAHIQASVFGQMNFMHWLYPVLMLNLWKREDLFFHNAGVKIEQVTAEGLADFVHEVFAHWNYWEAMGIHEVKGRELSYVILMFLKQKSPFLFAMNVN